VYRDILKPKSVYALHLSGHEDDQTDPNCGYGWPDERWAEEFRKGGVHLALQGQIIAL
jgi:hypothetical protein